MINCERINKAVTKIFKISRLFFLLSIFMASALRIASGGYNVTVCGGEGNTAEGENSVISAGKSNSTKGSYSTISGGSTNDARKDYSTISGGSNNTIKGWFGHFSTIAGGNSNTIYDSSNGDTNYSTIIGGELNSIQGAYSIIPGGSNNTVSGDYSLAAGRFMNTSGNHSFVWGYSNATIGTITTSDAMIIYSGSMGIRDTSPAALLEINRDNNVDDTYINLTSTTVATPGDIFKINPNGNVGVNQTNPTYPLHFGSGAYVSAAGNFMPACSRIYKENITDLGLTEAMDAFSKLTAVAYNYKNEKDHRYIGFIAEDVPDLVAQEGREGLSPMDIAAVLTKVVGHQQDILKQQKNETDKLLKEFKELRNKVPVKNQSKARLKNL